MTEEEIAQQESEFAASVSTVAPRAFDIWTKLLAGAEARAAEAERRVTELQCELAILKQDTQHTYTCTLTFHPAGSPPLGKRQA